MMAQKKHDAQKEFGKFMEQAKAGFKKFGEEISVLARKSEKEIVKVSKAGKIQLDIVALNMQKEKLYYDIGKKVVAMKEKDALDIPALEPYWKSVQKIEMNTRKKKKELSGVNKKK